MRISVTKLAKFHHFGFQQISKSLFSILASFLTYFGKCLMRLRKFLVWHKAKYLKSNLVIWSHWTIPKCCYCWCWCRCSVDSSSSTILPPGFESQACHLHFSHLKYLCYICHVKRTKNQKEAGFDPFLKNKRD